jgi:NTE family protein
MVLPSPPLSRRRNRLRAGMRVAIGCQGGGSHTAFTAGVLRRLLQTDVNIVALSGASGGAICALIAWYGLLLGDRDLARDRLTAFWEELSTREPWEHLWSQYWLFAYRVAGQFVSPEVNPYLFPASGQDRLRAAMERQVPFERLPELIDPDGPKLFVSAVDVRSGEPHIIPGEQITPETLLASAAIPTLFRAVHIGEHAYWDGLFAQNPPVRDLAWQRPDEIWIIQINRRVRASVPRSLADIRDRRNALSGNLSLEQELHPIERINGMLETGGLQNSDFRPITVRRIEMLRELDSASKLDRSPAFIDGMLRYGEERADAFLAER